MSVDEDGGIRFESWEVLERALNDVLSPSFTKATNGEKAHLLTFLLTNLSVRRLDVLPQDAEDRILNKLLAVATKRMGDVWHPDVCSFVVERGGVEAIERFVADHPDWHHIKCMCGHRDCSTMLVASNDGIKRLERESEAYRYMVEQIGDEQPIGVAVITRSRRVAEGQCDDDKATDAAPQYMPKIGLA